jgi:hypothetical protein
MRAIHWTLVGVALVQFFIGCADSDEASPSDEENEVAADASYDATPDSGYTKIDRKMDASNLTSDSGVCSSPAYPQAGTPCSGNVRCTMASPNHFDCHPRCPSRCSGGGTQYVPMTPPRAECKNDVWVVYPWGGAGLSCDSFARPDCICSDSGI